MNTTDLKSLKIIANILILASSLIIIYIANDILFPLLLAFLIAVLIRPIEKFLNERIKLPRILSISVTMLLAAGLCISVMLFMIWQMTDFMTDIPHSKKSLMGHAAKFDEWSQHLIGTKVIQAENIQISSFKQLNNVLMTSINSVSNGFMYVVMVPIYVFLFLLYRSLLLTFLLKLVPQNEIAELQQIVDDVKSVIRNYIVGLLIEVAVVALMTSAGLWISGVHYFIFLGILTAFLNLIPYIGIVIAFFVSSILALMNTTHFEVVLWILIVNMIVQFIDNNILMPRIVGSKVSINALASMLSVIIGGALAGMPGMFLAIPVTAILKVIFDRVTYLQPYGYILGDDIPKSFNWQKIKITSFINQRKNG